MGKATHATQAQDDAMRGVMKIGVKLGRVTTGIHRIFEAVNPSPSASRGEWAASWQSMGRWRAKTPTQTTDTTRERKLDFYRLGSFLHLTRRDGAYIGVVSRAHTTEPYLVDGSDPGETLAAPIEEAFYLKLALSRTENMYFAAAVQQRMINCFGPRALSAQVKAGDAPDQVAIRFALPAPSRWNY